MVRARFRNLDGRGPTLTANMTVDSEVVASKRVEIPANGTAEVTFEHTFSSTGMRTIAINGQTETVTVTPPTANLTIDQTTVDRSSLPAGETVTLIATVRNEGTAEGNMTLELEAFGETVERKEVTVQPGQVRSVKFSQQFATPGTHTLEVNGHAVTVEVTEADGDSDSHATFSADDSTETAGPGFGILAALFVLAVLLVLFARRR